MDTILTSQGQENIYSDGTAVTFFDAGKFFAAARKRMDERLARIRGEKPEGEEKIFHQSNDYIRS